MIDFIKVDFSIVSLCEIVVKIMKYIRSDFAIETVFFQLNSQIKKAKFFYHEKKNQ
nr:hypothetical protein [Buchnera aphidicola]